MNRKALSEAIIPTLYEDEQILAVEKPAGIDVGSVTKAAVGAGMPTIVGLLVEMRGDEPLEPANRLSRYESGVLLLGKTSSIVRHIRTGLRTRRIQQDYTAVLLGRMRDSTRTIDPAHGSSQGRRQKKGDPRRGRHRSTGPKSAADGLRSDRPTVIERVHVGPKRTLVICHTTVDTTHALKAQLRAVRLRMLGDKLHDRAARKQPQSATCCHLAKIAFHHPVRGHKVTIQSKPPPSYADVADGAADVERPLHAALARRLSFLANADTDSFRLITGRAEDLDGLVAEKYGNVVILQVLSDRPSLQRALPRIARWYRKTLGVKAVYAKQFIKDRAGLDEQTLSALSAPPPIAGKPVGDDLTIVEHGLRYAIRPHEGFSVGLFLDHRDNRSKVRTLARNKSVLNLFAYSCGFSVAAVAGGAVQAVSVDLSPKALDWGRANFALNGLDPDAHTFVKSDATSYLKRAARQARQFDIIVLDPPTFAHGRRAKRSFSVSRDLPALVSGAMDVMRPGGVLLVSTNSRQISLYALRQKIKQGAHGRPYHVTDTPPLPADFAIDKDHAKTVFVQLDD